MKKIKSMLYQYMHNRGVTLTEVSKATGLSRTTLTAINKDRAKGYQLRTIVKLCEYFGCQPGDLIKLREGEEEDCCRESDDFRLFPPLEEEEDED